MNIFKNICWLALMACALGSSTLANAASAAAAGPENTRADATLTQVFLVRHAERAEDGTRDPPISVAGQARAEELAELLTDARIEHLHTTDYLRTRQTLAPLAAMSGLPPRGYDPRDLQGFAAALRNTPGRHLVVGHSDTTPALFEALTGHTTPPIEALEYDRLYLVTMAPNSPATSVLFRFGTRYSAADSSSPANAHP